MPSGYGPWQAENHGHGGGLVLLLAVLVAVSAGVYWLLADTIFLPVAISVVSVLAVGGTAVAVRNVLRDRGLYRGEYPESLFRSPPRPAVEAVPVPALPVAVPLAIEAPRPVLTGVVVERELARVTSREDT